MRTRLSLVVFFCSLTLGGWAQPLRVASSAAKITPTVGADNPPVWLAGYGRGRQAEGIHDDLWARAVVFEGSGRRIAAVTLDLIGFFNEDVEQLRAELATGRPGARLDGCVVSSTHTHAGPDTMGLWGPNMISGGVDRKYNAFVIAQAAAAVRRAIALLAPATLRLAVSKTEGLQRDTRLPRVIDERLHVLEAVGGDGKPIVTIVHWSAHPTALDGKNRLISSDYVGPLVDRVSSRRGCPAIFWNGAIGGQISVSESEATTSRLTPRTFEYARWVGEAVAERACESLGGAQPLSAQPLALSTAPVFLPLANPIFRTALGVGVIKRRVYRDEKPMTSAGAVLAATHLKSEIGLLELGELHVGLVPGELYPELLDGIGLSPVDPGADFPDAPPEPAIRPILGGKHAFVIGLAGDEIGYIIPRSRWDELPPYCFGRTQRQYGEHNSVGPGTAPAIAEAFAALMKRLARR